MISTYSFVAESVSSLKAALTKAMDTIGFTPTLVFGFISVNLPITQFMDVFKQQGLLLYGVSSGGEVLFDQQQDNILTNAAVFVMTDLRTEVFDIQMMTRGNEETGDFATKLGTRVAKTFKKPSLILSTSGLDMDGQAMVEGILKITGKQTTIFGGMAADDGKFKQTFVFTESNITDHGALALILDSAKVELKGLATSGWIGLGSEFKVNRSEGNVVYEINDEPALDLYMDYLNVSEEDLPGIGLEYPFMLKKAGGERVIRAIMQIDADKRALVFAGSVPQGSVISFSSSPGFEIMENTRNQIIEFYNSNHHSDLLLLFSCVARHVALGPLISTEIKLASIKWKVPLIGLFTFGEFGTNQGQTCQFYNQTFTLALIRDIS
jgi:hypothetical protein